MKLHTFLFLVSLALLAAKVLGLLTISWFLVFVPALLGLGFVLFVLLVIGFSIIAGASLEGARSRSPLGDLTKR